MFGCGARGYTNTGKNWCYALEGLAPVHAPNSTPARQGCLHRFTGAGRRLVTKKPRARGENPPGICEARCLSRLRRALRFSRRVPLARGMSDNESSRCFPPLSLTTRAPPGAGRDPLEEMFGVRMVDHESLFFVFIETFGSCDSQLDCFYCVARY
ncbi:hypothetical protein PAPYR_12292 [Paratrimastix pyriformis]|uniref:Kringle domain-containing protein n=1 Tax=Paratrimastix pyriformis TaxID=342808 RepID=A0ABQ8U6P4_9EUKA|nr:hypothetical protein PAPYR_12292 [Paratrimastix pyriformis]